MKISKKALALLTSGAIAISTISAVVSRKVKEPYLVDENGMTWLTAKDYDTYTFNKALNEDGLYETKNGDIVSLENLKMDDTIYIYNYEFYEEIYKTDIQNDQRFYEAYPVFKTKREKHTVNYIYEGVDVSKTKLFL